MDHSFSLAEAMWAIAHQLKIANKIAYVKTVSSNKDYITVINKELWGEEK